MGKVGQTQNNMRIEEVAQLVTHLMPRCEELLFISGIVCKARCDGTHPEPVPGRARVTGIGLDLSSSPGSTTYCTHSVTSASPGALSRRSLRKTFQSKFLDELG